MKFLTEFLQQKAPRSGADMPSYYRRALVTSERLLGFYFPLMFLALIFTSGQWTVIPLALCAATWIVQANTEHMGVRLNICLYAAITLTWCGWYIYKFGWSSGVQPFLVPLIVFVFFNIYESPWVKMVSFLGLIVFRLALFYYSLGFDPQFELNQLSLIALQTLNSVSLFIIMACICILFSSSIQDTERQLRIDNQELHKEAGTDPLTLLPNRRAMLDEMALYQKTSSSESFSIAIADIDFFKSVNDTYGHNCGDYTLQKISELFRASAGTDYRVCRWGGEEFCFFLPGKNLDEAGHLMNDLCIAVHRMQITFEEHTFSIAVTIGVAENDFQSTMEAIINEADRKLYIGKRSGRNQVVL